MHLLFRHFDGMTSRTDISLINVLATKIDGFIGLLSYTDKQNSMSLIINNSMLQLHRPCQIILGDIPQFVGNLLYFFFR